MRKKLVSLGGKTIFGKVSINTEADREAICHSISLWKNYEIIEFKIEIEILACGLHGAREIADTRFIVDQIVIKVVGGGAEWCSRSRIWDNVARKLAKLLMLSEVRRIASA
ncbi:MAG: hypothetical protein EBR34_08015 [Sphingomonadaceae bacterium]|nr:hypothetical protein [Sphingomonadaceae bacterium]